MLLSQLHFIRRRLSRTLSSATLNGRPVATGDQLPVAGPRNPRGEADRGWLQRLVRPASILERDVQLQYIQFHLSQRISLLVSMFPSYLSQKQQDYPLSYLIAKLKPRNEMYQPP